MLDIVGKIIYIGGSSAGSPASRDYRGFVYHVEPERNVALVFWDYEGWFHDNEVKLTILKEWLDHNWCYLIETKGV